MPKLQVAGFLDNSLVNGEGLRTVIFLSGCKHNCEGCHNKELQDYNCGKEMTIDEIIDRIKKSMPLIKGVTFSGGDPLEQSQNLIELAKEIKKLGLNIWCYTGYVYEDIMESQDKYSKELIKNIDVLVDGLFEKDLMENAPKYAGSSNQRIIDVAKSLKEAAIFEIKNK